MNAHATALIADDEPLLRDALRRQLAKVWPELEIVAEARNGREAVRLFDGRHPDICFLDIHMPGLSGVDTASNWCSSPHIIAQLERRHRIPREPDRAHLSTFDIILDDIR